MIFFPAIDLKDGACVRLIRGEMGSATVFNSDPGAQAKAFEAQGIWLDYRTFHSTMLRQTIEPHLVLSQIEHRLFQWGQSAGVASNASRSFLGSRIAY